MKEATIEKAPVVFKQGEQKKEEEGGALNASKISACEFLAVDGGGISADMDSYAEVSTCAKTGRGRKGG